MNISPKYHVEYGSSHDITVHYRHSTPSYSHPLFASSFHHHFICIPVIIEQLHSKRNFLRIVSCFHFSCMSCDLCVFAYNKPNSQWCVCVCISDGIRLSRELFFSLFHIDTYISIHSLYAEIF